MSFERWLPYHVLRTGIEREVPKLISFLRNYIPDQQISLADFKDKLGPAFCPELQTLFVCIARHHEFIWEHQIQVILAVFMCGRKSIPIIQALRQLGWTYYSVEGTFYIERKNWDRICADSRIVRKEAEKDKGGLHYIAQLLAKEPIAPVEDFWAKNSRSGKLTFDQYWEACEYGFIAEPTIMFTSNVHREILWELYRQQYPNDAPDDSGERRQISKTYKPLLNDLKQLISSVPSFGFGAISHSRKISEEPFSVDISGPPISNQIDIESETSLAHQNADQTEASCEGLDQDSMLEVPDAEPTRWEPVTDRQDLRNEKEEAEENSLSGLPLEDAAVEQLLRNIEGLGGRLLKSADRRKSSAADTRTEGANFPIKVLEPFESKGKSEGISKTRNGTRRLFSLPTSKAEDADIDMDSESPVADERIVDGGFADAVNRSQSAIRDVASRPLSRCSSDSIYHYSMNVQYSEKLSEPYLDLDQLAAATAKTLSTVRPFRKPPQPKKQKRCQSHADLTTDAPSSSIIDPDAENHPYESVAVARTLVPRAPHIEGLELDSRASSAAPEDMSNRVRAIREKAQREWRNVQDYEEYARQVLTMKITIENALEVIYKLQWGLRFMKDNPKIVYLPADRYVIFRDLVGLTNREKLKHIFKDPTKKLENRRVIFSGCLFPNEDLHSMTDEDRIAHLEMLTFLLAEKILQKDRLVFVARDHEKRLQNQVVFPELAKSSIATDLVREIVDHMSVLCVMGEPGQGQAAYSGGIFTDEVYNTIDPDHLMTRETKRALEENRARWLPTEFSPFICGDKVYLNGTLSTFPLVERLNLQYSAASCTWTYDQTFPHQPKP